MDTKKNAFIEIDDGTREYTIKNKFGQTICVIHIRPGDLSIIERLETLQNRIPEITKDLESIDINADGTAVDTVGYKLIRQAEGRMAEELAKVFDTDEIMQIFEKRSMFSSVGGEFFASQVIEKLTDEIANTLKEETEKTQKRIDKYAKKKK